jgi:hypothetical protein
MKIYRDEKAPKYSGKGTHIELTGDEVAHAIRVYIYACNVVIDGPSTVRISVSGTLLPSGERAQDGDSGLCGGADVYVDPSGRVIRDGDEVK